MILVLMGVSGSGKSTVGKLLARQMGWPFYEGDDFHPEANIKKMAAGTPLTDLDREPWLRSLREFILRLLSASQDAIITCSALKEAYRHVLLQGTHDVTFVFLKGDYALIEKRLVARKGHYMKPGLLKSQFTALEEPGDALVIDIRQKPEAIVDLIKRSLGLPG